MLVGIIGRQGSAKTMMMSGLVRVIAHKTLLPIFANYKSLKGSRYVSTIDQVANLNDAILCLDELHTTMDSRAFKDNLTMTYFVTQIRKRGLLTFYTTQKFGQVDKRVRDATDILIECSKVKDGRQFTFMDLYTNRIGKRFKLTDLQVFFNLYDTKEVIKPLT